MKELVIDSYAKINIALDVLYKREDGYHEIETIMQQVDLKDTLIIKDKKEGILIECSNPEVPLDHSNIVYKAWKELKEKFGIDRGVHIIIKKNIPVAAGLAGGSTNAAAVLKGLNELWKLNLSEKELIDIGTNIGADVPFCIKGGTALAKGIGEKLEKLNSFSDHFLLLANSGIQVSTAYVYDNLKIDEIRIRPDMNKLLEAIHKNDIETVSKNMVNVLEQVTMEEYWQIEDIKNDMIKYGALGCLMSGSGPTVFGFFDNKVDLKRCKKELEKKKAKVIISKTV